MVEWWFIFVLLIAACILGSFLGVGIYICRRYIKIVKEEKKEKEEKEEKEEKDSFVVTIFNHFLHAEDLNFVQDEDKIASLQIVGKGGCGDVYKVDLPQGRIKTVVLKKIREVTEADNKTLEQMRAELQTVSNLRHRNVLPLLAHITKGSCHYLVFEYMKSGSLKHIMDEVHAGARELHWPQRRKIALQVAAGLEYIHESQNACILHRDLKPSNILLDEDLEARITDFGLSTLLPNEKTHVWFSNVAGTFGYLAPEYSQTGRYSKKSDMYSFGVILGVLVTGKFPSNDPEIAFTDWLINVVNSKNPKAAIDNRIIGNGDEEQIIQALKIACLCTSRNPIDRLDIRYVIELLKAL